jgi:RecB family exonuclease
MAMADLYMEDGRPVVTHSMIKTFRRCPRQTMYKYVDRLKPRALSKPLKRGTWIHSLLETHYTGGDWEDTHKKLTAKFNGLFVEEQEHLGDLPREIKRLMNSYFWHYRDDQDWIVHETEFTIETELPNGELYRGRVDNLIENDFGLYVVDHKSHKSLPNLNDRLLDPQSVLYIWAARRVGIPVKGFIWNYIRTDAPKDLRFKLDGGLYAKQGDTDYPTAYRSIKKQGHDPRSDEWRPYLKRLQAMRFQPGATQMSPFFLRHTLEKDEAMIDRAVAEVLHTVERMGDYDFEHRDSVERVVDRSCAWMCGFQNLCITDLMGGNSDLVKKQSFKIGDPMDYYQDTKDKAE